MNYSLFNLLRILALIFAAWFFSGCYLIKQGACVLRYQMSARSVESLLANPSAPDSLKEFLRFTQQVRSYATTEIGLKKNRNYTTYVDVPGKKYLLDVVGASAADTFRAFLWHFPIVGDMPYMGYFNKADALTEAQRLRGKGFDVLVRGAGAFSSLGFFRDPIYSFMSGYSRGEVAALIIHEETHATLFLKNQVSFNEQMATFVGDEGALRFLADTYGDTSQYYHQAVDGQKDFDTYMAALTGLHDSLDLLYRSKIPTNEKLVRKRVIINQWREAQRVDLDKRFRTPLYKKGFESSAINNAEILSYMTYAQDLSAFRRLYQKNGFDLRKTVEALKELAKGKGDAAGKLNALVSEKDGG